MIAAAAAARELVLATDLDGTLLAGSQTERARLVELLRRRAASRVVFVTGRNPTTVRPLLSDPLVPAPDYIVGDVGATVVAGPDLTPLEPLHQELERAWPGREAVELALASFSVLEPQDVPQERRCSYHVRSPRRVTPALHLAVESVGCTALFSAGRYLDVLASGVSKGSTLRRLIAQEGLDPESVVVTGDSLNDLSMFETGLKGVIVGNAEPELKRLAAGMDSTFLATRHGVGGILEGLEHYGFVEGTGGHAA